MKSQIAMPIAIVIILIAVIIPLPAIILDVAHNLASIEALLAVLRERFSPRRRIAIFASSKDKDYTGMLQLAFCTLLSAGLLLSR